MKTSHDNINTHQEVQFGLEDQSRLQMNVSMLSEATRRLTLWTSGTLFSARAGRTFKQHNECHLNTQPLTSRSVDLDNATGRALLALLADLTNATGCA